ncbi:proteinase B [Entomophthora muscae]|uniref:Proteinase B n=1 Tax=Entomophthora muscae TaxID=34485 RepID=A0ACC2SVD8_9FUNG|nr:proteinase B [Entomophthora muscae]
MKSFIEISLISVLFHGGYAKQVQTGHTEPTQGSYVKGSYIVTLKSSTEDNVLKTHIDKIKKLFGSDQGSGGKIKINHVYGKVLLGYSAKFTDEALAKIKAMPEFCSNKRCLGTGSSLISHTPSCNSEHLSYNYDPSAGEGVDVYVIDSGIKIDHPEFGGRAKWGKNFVNENDNANDEYGHGTQVAGIIGSDTYGVAKKATLIAVKVFNGQGKGNTDDFIAGVNWAVENKKEGRGCVINFSLESSWSKKLNKAVYNAVESGCAVIAAAGNKNKDAYEVSPASERAAFTVGASNLKDERASFSNWGDCLDAFAPGENILSLSINGNPQYVSGTSMAAAHVSGLTAIFMSKNENYFPFDVYDLLIDSSQRDVLENIGKGSPNLLVSNFVPESVDIES